jgi:hypothetical protein
VAEWLEHRRGLPRETRGYVVHVTGRSVEQWRSTPPDDDSVTFVHHLPCRSLPAFADLEQAQMAEMQAKQAAAKEAEANQSDAQAEHHAHDGVSPSHSGRRHFAARVHEHAHASHEVAHNADHERRHARREAVRTADNDHHHTRRRGDNRAADSDRHGGHRHAERAQRATHEKRKSA